MADREQESPRYEVLMTDEAYLSFVALPNERLFNHMSHSIELLATSPLLGRIYDPAYEAKRPSFDCRVLYCEHYGIYYLADETALTVHILAIEDQRRNPMDRFSSIVYAVESLE